MKSNLADFPSCNGCPYFTTIGADEPQGSCTLRKPLRDLECLAIKWKEDFEASEKKKQEEGIEKSDRLLKLFHLSGGAKDDQEKEFDAFTRGYYVRGMEILGEEDV